MKLIRYVFSFLALSIFITAPALGAVTFTDTPSVVSNTYSGFITLQINGITSGDTVVVQKYLDANTNGIVNGSDPLVQQFNLTDGQAGQVIGGIVNSNVPGDLTITNGAITAQLNFQNGDIAQNMTAKYLYVLSSPVGHFAAITNSFVVTNFPFGQTISGNVTSNTLTGAALSNSIIIVFPGPTPQNDLGQPVAGTVANNAGAYSLSLPVGTYRLVPFHTNFVTAIANAPIISLGSGASITTNLVVTNGSASISVVLEDSTNSAVRLPGIFMPFQNSSGYLAIGFSDTNGNCTARVLSGTWSVGTDDSGFIIHGYVASNNGSNITAGASGVVLPYHHANALFYGSVLDGSGNPIVGVDISDFDTTSNLFQLDGYTDPNGYYAVGAIGYGSADPWQISISEDTGVLTNYIVSNPSANQSPGTNIVAGTASLQNFNAILATNHIVGSVTNNTGGQITNIQVFASAEINGINYQVQAFTDVHGDYVMNVANGTWTVSLDCSGDQNSLPSNYGCPASDVVTINNNNISANFLVVACGNVLITSQSPLPPGETNAPYFETLQASSCNANFTWQQTGGTLPPGVSFDSSGDVFGTPTTTGVYSFNVQVTDGNNATANGTFSLTVSNGVSITTTSLPSGTNGLSYSQQLTATNGTPPYSWYLLSGSTPPTLSLSTTGLLSGPVTSSGTFNFTVQVTDAAQGVSAMNYSLIVNSTNIPTLSVGTASGQIIVLWPASAGTNFTLQMTTNLSNPNWVPATNGVLQNAYLFTNSSAQEFFRLQ